MHFALAFVAILVVSWASSGEGVGSNEGSAGAKTCAQIIAASSKGSSSSIGSTVADKCVTVLPTSSESSRKVIQKPDNNIEVISPSGGYISLKDLVASYVHFTRSDVFQKTGKFDKFPSEVEVEKAITTGKRFDPECEICKVGGACPFGKPKKRWYEYICF